MCKCTEEAAAAQNAAAQSVMPLMIMARYVGPSTTGAAGEQTGFNYGKADQGLIRKVFSQDVDGILFEAL